MSDAELLAILVAEREQVRLVGWSVPDMAPRRKTADEWQAELARLRPDLT